MDMVSSYHERTKHHRHRFAAGPGMLDWATQPDPFRRYRGAPLMALPLNVPLPALPYETLHARDAGVRAAPLDIASLSLFFRLSLSLTAWKEFRGTRWALRANPSSGNLHPTEGYAVLPAIEGLGSTPGVYHYTPREHALEERAAIPAGSFAALAAGRPEPCFLAGLSSIHWREAWKYGERAYRYCQHDCGHAIAALRLAAAALGWSARLVAADDEATGALLGLDREGDFPGGAEREEPDCLIEVTPGPGAAEAVPLPVDAARAAAASGVWSGQANRLSAEHAHDWPVIDQVTAAAHGSLVVDIHEWDEELAGGAGPAAAPLTSGKTAAEVILGRRSAVAMDAETRIPVATFYRMLARLMPGARNAAIPWDALPWRPRVHLALFVHRVDGLDPGLYLLARDPRKIAFLRDSLRRDLAWEPAPGSSPDLPFFLLASGDLRGIAAEISCQQAIAADGAASLGMLAEMRTSLERFGAPFYRRLFWETGMIGQVLYLEAEAAGIRGTGIGCYFDDLVHELCGITDDRLQSLYHFTVGGAVEDSRLTTLPPYPAGGSEPPG